MAERYGCKLVACTVPLSPNQEIYLTIVLVVAARGDRPSIEQKVLKDLEAIPYITVAHITTGKFNIYCKLRARDTKHAKELIFMIDDIEGISRTETMISLEESINDKKRLMHSIFNEL